VPPTRAEIEELKSGIERYAIERFTEPVKLASGGTSLYYSDGKRISLHPVYARLIGRMMAPAVIASGAEAVGGMAVGSIPLSDAVAAAALDLGHVLPTFFARPEAKDHGPGAKAQMSAAATADGTPLIRRGRRVGIVEDAVTQGGSVLKAVDAVVREGCEVVLVYTIVERHEGGGARVRDRGIPFRRLFYTLEDGSLHIDEQLLAEAGAPSASA
jgi:orotate phosphoribosyltransferase